MYPDRSWWLAFDEVLEDAEIAGKFGDDRPEISRIGLGLAFRKLRTHPDSRIRDMAFDFLQRLERREEEIIPGLKWTG